MALTTRIVSHNEAEKAREYFNKVGSTSWILDKKVVTHKEGVYSHLIGLPNDGLMLEAFIEVSGTKVSIHRICRLEKNITTGRFVPSMFEKGKYGKVLAEKYLNRFFDTLDDVEDMDDVKGEYITVTPSMVIQKEKEIDETVNYPFLSDTDIEKYNHTILIAHGLQSLEWFMNGIVEGEPLEYTMNYDGVFTFEVAISAINLAVSISIAEIVRKKWETGECFSKALLICVCDSFVAKGF